MAKGTYKHNNFSSGQYDREFVAQDNAIHQNGLAYCKNVMSSVQGELKTRPGTEWKADLDTESVIIPFRRAESDLALVIGAGTLNIKTIREDGSLADFIPTTSNKFTWENTANGTPTSTAVSATGVVTSPDNLYKGFTQNISTLISSYSTNRFYVNGGGTYPTTHFNMTFTANNGQVLNTVSMGIIPADGNFNQPNLDKVRNWVKDVVLQYSDDGTNWTTERLARPWRFGWVRHDTTYGTREISHVILQTLNPQKHTHWRVSITWLRNNIPNNAPMLVSFYNNVLVEIQSSVQTYSVPFTQEKLKSLKYSQRYNELYICDGEHSPEKIVFTGNTPSVEPIEYAFEETDGHPSCVRFFQNRLWYGGFEAFPTRVRGSRFDDISDFVIVTTNVTAVDPILAEGNQISERITDLWGGFNVLYAQSPDGISFIESAGDAVAPTRMNFTLKCYEKASGITPTMKENIMFYVGLDRKRIHAFTYDNALQQFVAPDVSLYWQEVLKDQISEIHFVDSRNKNIIGTLENGRMFAFLYDVNGTAGFFPIDVGGKVYDATVLKHDSDINVYITINRGNNWYIEKFHMPEFMQRTDAFLQTVKERNLATQENLIKTPFFDNWRTFKSEHEEQWEYEAETNIVKPAESLSTPTDLTGYVGKIVRFYYGANSQDFYDLFIKQAFTEEREVEIETEVTTRTDWYGWSNTTSIKVVPIPGRTPALSGIFTRYPTGDIQSGVGAGMKAWKQGNTVQWTSNANPKVGETLKGVQDRIAPHGTIVSVTSQSVLTLDSTPSIGSDIYDTEKELSGTVESLITNGFVYNDAEYTRDSTLDDTDTETHTEVRTITVEAGYYEVENQTAETPESQLFTKLQLPLYAMSGVSEPIQVQDNGVYLGDFEPDETGTIHFVDPVYSIQFGLPYEKIGVIQEFQNKGYLKEWGTVAISLIDTMSLKVGSSMSKLEKIVEFKANNTYYNTNTIMENGVILKNIPDTDDYDKKLILYSKDGLPFCVNGLESEMLISDIGGN